MKAQFKRPVIAVAGSSGKTTTKEMIASILRQEWKIFKSPGNRNNRQDIRGHLRRIKPYHRAIVLEFGMSARGHLTRSCQIIKPNMAVITMVGTSHIGKFGGSLTNLAHAKSELIMHMHQNGILFLNADDKNSRLLQCRSFRGRIIRVGIENEADYRASQVDYTANGMSFQVRLNGRIHRFYIPIFGRHNVYNALFAIALAHVLGFNPETIKTGLKLYQRPNRRLKIYKLNKDIKLIDDTFNANPHSVKAALDVLTAIGKDRNVAVLGDMTELGRYSIKGHVAVGKYAAKSNLSNLYTYGDKARQITSTAIKEGFPRHRAIHSATRANLHKSLARNLLPGSTVLVKGSHSTAMHKTIRFLKQQYR